MSKEAVGEISEIVFKDLSKLCKCNDTVALGAAITVLTFNNYPDLKFQKNRLKTQLEYLEEITKKMKQKLNEAPDTIDKTTEKQDTMREKASLERKRKLTTPDADTDFPIFNIVRSDKKNMKNQMPDLSCLN